MLYAWDLLNSHIEWRVLEFIGSKRWELENRGEMSGKIDDSNSDLVMDMVLLESWVTQIYDYTILILSVEHWSISNIYRK